MKVLKGLVGLCLCMALVSCGDEKYATKGDLKKMMNSNAMCMTEKFELLPKRSDTMSLNGRSRNGYPALNITKYVRKQAEKAMGPAPTRGNSRQYNEYSEQLNSRSNRICENRFRGYGYSDCTTDFKSLVKTLYEGCEGGAIVSIDYMNESDNVLVGSCYKPCYDEEL